MRKDNCPIHLYVPGPNTKPETQQLLTKYVWIYLIKELGGVREGWVGSTTHTWAVGCGF